MASMEASCVIMSTFTYCKGAQERQAPGPRLCHTHSRPAPHLLLKPLLRVALHFSLEFGVDVLPLDAMSSDTACP